MYNHLKYLFFVHLHGGRSRRYRNLFRVINAHRCKTIVEIGTNRAKNAVRMIHIAKIHHRAKQISYFGFDLFEGLSESELKAELSKMPSPQETVEERLKITGVSWKIYKGYTKTTLPEFVDYAAKNSIVVDFVFIDGGHSEETIASDWDSVRRLMNMKTVVIFDDYYHNDEPGVSGFGCNKLVGSLDKDIYDIKILDPIDCFSAEWGTLKVSVVKVMLRK